jgi:hypothetical protein
MSEITSSSNYNVSVGAEIVTPTTQKNQTQAVKVEKV